jgi:hypothetical protein
MTVSFLDLEQIEYEDFPLPVDLQNDGRDMGEDLTACFSFALDNLTD